MTSPHQDDEFVIEALPGETEAEFIARVVAAAGRPGPELAAELRRLLPPVTAEQAEDAA
ncbi:hypothetical protein GCM10027258_63150 [Amycolatopsis stemonae]